MHLAGGMCCPIAAATLPREAHALAAADLTSLARRVRQPVLLLVGTASPPWASELAAKTTSMAIRSGAPIRLSAPRKRQ